VHDIAFRDLGTLLKSSHPYVERFKSNLGAIQDHLWEHLDATENLEQHAGLEVLSYLLELACQSQNILNIDLGRAGILALPKSWLLENIESVAESRLNLQAEWEYRRLLEIVWKLDRELVRKMILKGLDCPNIGVREAAEESKSELNKIQ